MKGCDESIEKGQWIAFLFLNIQGVSNKYDLLEDFCVRSDCFDFVCVSEHWLDKSAKDQCIISGFKLAAFYAREERAHGGTLILCADHIVFQSVDLSQFCVERHMEACAVRVQSHKLIIVSLYHTPDGNPNLFLEKLEEILCYLNKWCKYRIVLGGDLNAHFDILRDQKTTRDFINLLRQFDFYCCNFKPTRNLACLDNVFSNADFSDVKSRVLPCIFSDHDAVKFELRDVLDGSDVSHDVDSSVKAFRSLSAENIEHFKCCLSRIDWSLELSLLDCDVGSTPCSPAAAVFQTFFNTLMYHFDLACPKKYTKKGTISCKTKNLNKPWFSRELAALRLKVMAAYDSYKVLGTDFAKSEYKILRGRYKETIRMEKLNHNGRVIDSSSNKCKAAWTIINKMRPGKSKQSITPIQPDTFAQFFSKYIEDIRKGIKQNSIPFQELLRSCPVSAKNFHWRLITRDDVCRVIKNLKPSRSRDLYGFSNSLMKEISDLVAEPLALCINACLRDGVFPDFLKIARVCPIFKKGNRKDPADYRPISLIPVLAKVIESLVAEQLSSFFESSGIFTRSQYGFRKGRSTVEAIDALVTDILNAFERREFAWGTFCDLSRAFDCVDHKILIEKLNFYGVEGSVLNFIGSYLSNRKQTVEVDGRWSPVVNVECGVPQGSIMGPLLFLIAINDLPNNVDSNTYIYADDTTLIDSDSDVLAVGERARNSTKQASDWFSANGFLLNQSKTQMVVFSLRPYSGDSLVTNKAKFLGLIVDRDLSWAPHIDAVLDRLSRVNFLLSRLMCCVPFEYVKSTYFALFQSVMSYGLMFWGNATKTGEVLIMQKRAIRIMSGAGRIAHCKPLFLELRILTVVNLYIYNSLVHAYKGKHKHQHRINIHGLNTRRRHDIDVPFVRLEKLRSSHLIMSIRLFNKLPLKVRNLSLREFKCVMYGWLCSNPFYEVDEFLQMSEPNIEMNSKF